MAKTQNENIRVFAFGPVLFATDSSSLDSTIEIHDLKIIDIIKSGITGLSPDLIIKKFQCSICGQDFENCDHEDDQVYDGVECHPLVSSFDAGAVSAVKNPADSRARITDMLLIEGNGKRKEYTWYGFKADTENRRFRHIQRACDDDLISESAALYFSNFFMNNFEGEAKYPPKIKG